MFRSNKMSVVTYINKQGGTRSPTLCMRTWQLLQYLDPLHASITATHLAGILNTKADHLSRHNVEATEWGIHPSVIASIFKS